VTADSTGHPTPAWDQVSFSALPAFESAGGLDIPEDATRDLGYNLSRSWQAGDSVLNVLKLGDVQDAFALGNFRLGDSVHWGGLDPTTLSLSNFSFLTDETVAELVSQIPAIAGFKISEVRPLYDLITQSIPNVAQTLSRMSNFRVWTEQPIAALAQLPEVGNLSLNHLDLSQYSFRQLPGLEAATLSSIRDWKNLHLAEILGLSNVPFSAFFNPGQFLGLIAIHDVTYGGDNAHQESRWTPTQHSITGSYKVGFNHECAQAQGCDYLELSSPISLGSAGDPTRLHGARWIRGGYGAGRQMVPGGHGVLGTINGGQEPTGRHPFGKAFKVVLTDTDESTGTGKFGLYFRVCHRSAFVDLGCTPYFIGPVPWFPTHEKGGVLVGLTEIPPPSGIQEPEIPPEVQEMIDQYDPGTNSGNDAQTCKIDPSKLDPLSRSLVSSLSDIREQLRGSQFIPHILRACAKAGVTDSAQLAYILATAEHETNHFRTMEEYQKTPYDSGGVGEGMIQVTWCDKKQFVFQKLGLSAYRGVTDKRLQQPTIAADALCRGIKEGWYGQMRPIGQCISGRQADYGCARQQVNDHDRVEEIANYARNFRRALQKSGTSAAGGALTCSSPAANTSGTAKTRSIYQTAENMQGFSTADSPTGGNVACAWAVNEVLYKTIGKRIGDNPNYVPSVQSALAREQGVEIPASQARPGDLAIAKDMQHIGICTANGCNQILSNSSSRSSFSWRSNGNFDGSYDQYGGTTHYYRVK
jgi:hypothetical protein